MPTEHQTLRVAILAWEIGRVSSGLGTKIGGLGTIIEELPPELVKTARQQNIDLDIEILSPCFAHYDKRQLTRLDINPQVTLDGHTFPFEVYEHVFDDGQSVELDIPLDHVHVFAAPAGDDPDADSARLGSATVDQVSATSGRQQ